MRLFFAFILASFVSGCLEDEDERFDAGHSDGYAVGYKALSDKLDGVVDSP